MIRIQAKGKQVNTLKQFCAIFGAGLMLVSSLLVWFPYTTFALNAEQEAKYDYDLAVASLILSACVSSNAQSINKADYGRVTWADRGAKYDVSTIWVGAHKTEVAGMIDCNTPKDMATVVQVYGFASVREFNNFIAPQRGEGSRCSGDACQLLPNWKSAISTYAREKNGRPGPDNAESGVSLAGQYYFWVRSFRDGKCEGNVYSKQENYDNKPANQRVKGPIYWSENGRVVEKIGAGFAKLSNDAAYQDLGPDYFDNDNIRYMVQGDGPSETNLMWYSDPNGDNKFTCADIISKLKDKKYAQAYTELAIDRKNAGEGGGENITFNSVYSDEGDGNKKSCTERFLFSAGWIVCSVLELVSDGISSLFDIADSMLNVDGQNLYDSGELRAIWSYFRVVATFALVIIGLVMVISQAIGGGL